MDRPARRDDRWLTPGVVIVLILAGSAVCLGVVAAVTFLTARGFDPQPVVQLAGTLVAACAALGTFVQGLVTRRTTTKVERNTGTLATGVGQVVDELDASRGRHGARVLPMDPATRPHPFTGRSAAPAAGREMES